MKTKIKAKKLLSTKLHSLSDKVNRELRKMQDADIYPKYPAKMFKRMERLYYDVGKTALAADRIEEEKGWVPEENDPLKWLEVPK
jgi:hypothetical protein